MTSGQGRDPIEPQRPGSRAVVASAALAGFGALCVAGALYAATQRGPEGTAATCVLSAVGAAVWSAGVVGGGALAARARPNADRLRSGVTALVLAASAVGLALLAWVTFANGVAPQRFLAILPAAMVLVLGLEVRRALRGYARTAAAALSGGAESADT